MNRFVIYGQPKGKGRPRFARAGRFTRTYTPKDTVEYENLVKLSYKMEMGDAYHEGPLDAEITAFFSIPKSVSKKKRQQMIDREIPHTSKPDCDNIAKTILDALNGIAYHDDSQIHSLTVKKFYGEEPRVEVILSEK